MSAQYRGSVVDVKDRAVWGRLNGEQRSELTAFVAQQVGHRVRGVQRVEIRDRLFRARTMRVSGIVRVETKPGVHSAILDPLRPHELARFTGEFRVRTPLPSWWRR